MNLSFAAAPAPDWESLLRCLRRESLPSRAHVIELFWDPEIETAIAESFSLLRGLDPSAPDFPYQRKIRLMRFLGYDYVRCGVDGFHMPLHWAEADDTAALAHDKGRQYINEQRGPIQSWDDFERFPWPKPEDWATTSLEWYEKHLPDDMCVIGSGGFAHFAEYLCWLMGYESLCYALYDQRDLVLAIAGRLHEIYVPMLQILLQFERVKIIWGSDDMGYKTGTLISPDDLREFVLPGHKRMAQMSHDAGRPYLLHSCGKLTEIMEDLIENVRIDAKHSFEDTIESIADCRAQYGDRIALLGGIDVDFLCRADEAAIRARVRHTLDTCMPYGGFCLGTGNSVANYIPLDHYLAMVDEAHRWRYP